MFRLEVLADLCLSHLCVFHRLAGLVLFFGSNIKGATSWFSFRGFSFQPSEIGKVWHLARLGRFSSVFYSTDLKVLRSQLFLRSSWRLILWILQQPMPVKRWSFCPFSGVVREGLNPAYYVVAKFEGLTRWPIGFNPLNITLTAYAGFDGSCLQPEKTHLYWVLRVLPALFHLAQLEYLSPRC